MRKKLQNKIMLTLSCMALSFGFVMAANTAHVAPMSENYQVITAQAASIDLQKTSSMVWEEGVLGEGLTAELSDGKLTISGNGEMKNMSSVKSEDMPWTGRYIRSIVVEEGVTNVGAGMFRDLPALTTVTLSSTVTSIDSAAFSSCSALSTVNFSQGLETIGVGAFFYCPRLQKVTLPEGVTTIGDGAFEACLYLRSIVIPKSVTMIEWYAFDNCYSLNKIYYGGTAEEWEQLQSAMQSKRQVEGNEYLFEAKVSYYSEEQPEANTGLNYWHWNSNGQLPVDWTFALVTGSIKNYIKGVFNFIFSIFSRIF